MAQAYLGNYTKASTNGTATSLTMSKPTGVVDGDLLLLLMGNENSANGEGFDVLTGWNLEFNYGSGGVDTYIGLYSRIATGDALEDNPIVPFLAGDDGHGWYINVKATSSISPIQVSQELVSNRIVYGNYLQGMTPPESIEYSVNSIRRNLRKSYEGIYQPALMGKLLF